MGGGEAGVEPALLRETTAQDEPSCHRESGNSKALPGQPVIDDWPDPGGGGREVTRLIVDLSNEEVRRGLELDVVKLGRDRERTPGRRHCLVVLAQQVVTVGGKGEDSAEAPPIAQPLGQELRFSQVRHALSWSSRLERPPEQDLAPPSEPLGCDLGQQARLADPGFAEDDRDLPPPFLGLSREIAESSELGVASDQQNPSGR